VLDVIIIVSTQGLVVKTSITDIVEAAATTVGVPLIKKQSVTAPIWNILAPTQVEISLQNW
jgi:hypothetical protein